MDEGENSGYDSAEGYASGPVQFEFVDTPALNGEQVEWTYRTVGRGRAEPGTVTSQIAVMSHDHRILGGGNSKLGGDLGPNDIGGGHFSPVQYTSEDGEYYVSVTVGDDVRYVSYCVHDRRAYAN